MLTAAITIGHQIKYSKMFYIEEITRYGSSVLCLLFFMVHYELMCIHVCLLSLSVVIGSTRMI